jgi:SAM-dependent methyltransferase
MKPRWSILFIAILHAAALPVIALPPTGESSVRPGVNDKYLAPDLDVEVWIERFEGESRQIFRSRAAIVAALNLRNGLRVGDIGAGTGLFMRPIAEAVGRTGKVFAVEISPRFIEHLEAIKQVEQLGAVEIVEGGARSAGLAANSIDLAFICDVYHHFEFPKAMLASLRLALRPAGELVVVDFKRIPGKSEEWILDHVRAGQDVFTREILDAGFELLEEVSIDTLEDNYVLRFRSP